MKCRRYGSFSDLMIALLTNVSGRRVITEGEKSWSQRKYGCGWVPAKTSLSFASSATWSALIPFQSDPVAKCSAVRVRRQSRYGRAFRAYAGSSEHPRPAGLL